MTFNQEGCQQKEKDERHHNLQLIPRRGVDCTGEPLLDIVLPVDVRGEHHELNDPLREDADSDPNKC